jgi:hypothetical protein
MIPNGRTSQEFIAPDLNSFIIKLGSKIIRKTSLAKNPSSQATNGGRP